MRKKITFLILFSSFSIWSQTHSGGGTIPGSGGGTGISITISSLSNSDSIEIFPNLVDANIVGYKIYNSNLELKKDITILPTNNEKIIVNDLPKDLYYIQLVLDKGNSIQIISKEFIKE